MSRMTVDYNEEFVGGETNENLVSSLLGGEATEAMGEHVSDAIDALHPLLERNVDHYISVFSRALAYLSHGIDTQHADQIIGHLTVVRNELDHLLEAVQSKHAIDMNNGVILASSLQNFEDDLISLVHSNNAMKSYAWYVKEFFVPHVQKARYHVVLQ